MIAERVIPDQTAAFFAILNRERRRRRLWHVAASGTISCAIVRSNVRSKFQRKRTRRGNRLNIPPLFRPFLRQSRKERRRNGARENHATALTGRLTPGVVWLAATAASLPHLNDVYTGRGVPKCRRSMGGCVNLVQWIWPECIPKIV